MGHLALLPTFYIAPQIWAFFSEEDYLWRRFGSKSKFAHWNDPTGCFLDEHVGLDKCQ